MKFWKKVALSIFFILIPTPDIEISVKIDMNDDDKPDMIFHYRDLKFDIKKINSSSNLKNYISL